MTNIIRKLKSKIANLESFDSAELTERKFNDHFDMLIFGKSPESSLQEEHSQFFRGMMVDPVNRGVVLGQDGFTLWKVKNKISDYRLFEGGFVSIEWSGKSIQIQHDCFGLYPIFRYSDDEICIVSDSLFLISRTMKMIGKNVKLNNKANLTRAWTYGLACSIMTKQSIIQNVIYVPPCAMLKITTIGAKVISSEEQLNVKKAFTLEEKPYMENLVKAKEEIISLVNAITKTTNLGYKLGLSGGLDSRIILALLFQISDGLEKAYINSNTHASRTLDYQIVKSLCEKFNFEINHKIPSQGRTSIRVQNPYGNFILFNLGVFDMTYLYRSHWDTPSLIEIGGHGAEISKGTFSNIKLTSKMPIWRPDKKMALYKHLGESLKPFGIRVNERNSTQWHHLLYKSAIQNGRYLERTQLSLRPLMNRKLASLGLNNQEKENTILKDLLILLSPKLAAHPFDESSKNIDQDYISEIVNESKKYTVISNKETSVYGDSDRMKNGFLNSFTSMTEKYHLDDVEKKKSLLDLMEDTWANIKDKKVKRTYSKAYEMAKMRLMDEASYLPSAGSPASKIIALGILFE